MYVSTYIHMYITPFSLTVVLLQVTVKELMGAAGLFDLEATSDAIGEGNESYRERGCVIRVSIAYDNWRKTLFGTQYVLY